MSLNIRPSNGKPQRTGCFLVCLLAGLLPCVPIAAEQVDIPGPPGSYGFGQTVTVLPNGNFVVTDLYAFEGENFGGGAVHLYDADANLISSLTGRGSANPEYFGDQVGSGGIVVLANGNFLVLSPEWSNGDAHNAGAVTWVDADIGLSGLVGPANSLVGSSQSDGVGSVLSGVSPGKPGVVPLPNGNYVVASPDWRNASAPRAGAVTWANGDTGVAGVVSSGNSLVGTSKDEQVGLYGAHPLANGNYVVESPDAATWGDGSTGVSGIISPTNSFMGVGSVTVLTNGNYVVANPDWDSASATNAGAVTWCRGSNGCTGFATAGNSLVGASQDDRVGDPGVTALTNGHYVVRSSRWANGVVRSAGAATWGNGDTGTVGQVSMNNSLVGMSQILVGADQYCGFVDAGRCPAITPLANGNYVVRTPTWTNAAGEAVGAITWASGASGRTGYIQPRNSLTGTGTTTQAGWGGVTPLANGNYVVSSPHWSNGTAEGAGAVTWAPGHKEMSGVVSTANSLTGTGTWDHVGLYGVTALANGHYVVLSADWRDKGSQLGGAATWMNGSVPASGVVSAANSLVANQFELSRSSVTPLSNGNYVVAAPMWNNGANLRAGAATWGNGATGTRGTITAANSLVGSRTNDGVEPGISTTGFKVSSLEDGNYVVANAFFDYGATVNAGAVSLSHGGTALVGAISENNSVFETRTFASAGAAFSYDSARSRLLVGRPFENTVSIFTPSDILFADDFE